MQDNKPKGRLVVLYLVRISYILASFPEPVLARSNFHHVAFSGFEQKNCVEKSSERALFTKKTYVSKPRYTVNNPGRWIVTGQ